MTERLIGIDFGTSTTVVHVKSYTDGVPADYDRTSVQYVDFDGQGIVPTLIQEAEGTYYFGYDAKQPKQGEKQYRNFKLDLESADPEKREKARKLTRMFFEFLYETYDEQRMHFGAAQQEKTLVSYPAKWTSQTQEFMISCAEQVGFSNVQGVDEPTAALYSVCVQESERIKAFGTLDSGRQSYILMIDMGAGTTDLALCRYTAGAGAEILLTWPKTEDPLYFGGHEMDRILMDILKNYLLENGFSQEGVERFMKQYEETCKSWKENTVSSVLDQGKQVDFCFFISSIFQIMGITPGKFPVISRDSLEQRAGAYLKLYAVLINGLLDEAQKRVEGFGGDMIDLVILTGGHSQWYFARDILTGEVNTGMPVRMERIKAQPERILRLSRPQETVARGMVYSAQELEVISKGADSKETASNEATSIEVTSEEETTDAEKYWKDPEQTEENPERYNEIRRDEPDAKVTIEGCINECDYLFQKSLRDYLGELYLDHEDAFVKRLLKEKHFYLGERLDVIPIVMRAYGKPVTTGTEKILCIRAAEGMLNSCLGYTIVTTEKILQLDKNSTTCREYSFCDIAYIKSAMRDYSGGRYPGCFQYVDRYSQVQLLNGAGSADARVYLCAYVRWRALHGMSPYGITAANYYETVKNTGECRNGMLLNQIGLDYMSSGQGKNALPEKGFQFFHKAVEAGSVPALLNLAYCYARAVGCGPTWDYRRAAEYIERFTGAMTGKERMEDFFFFPYYGWPYNNSQMIKGYMPYFIGEIFERGGFGLEPDPEKAILYYSMGRKVTECTKAEARLRAQKTLSFFKKKK